MVDWVNGHAKLKSLESSIATAQNLLWKWWSRDVDPRRRVVDWEVQTFREQHKEAGVWTGKGVKGREVGKD